MKKLWTCIHAGVASIAWVFILLALCLTLLDPKSGINQDPVFAVIAIFVTIGHLCCGSYLLHRISEEIREAKKQKRMTSGAGNGKERHIQSSS
ncbi:MULTISPECIES: hypothetical protein [unclassified Variovorax]|uniref:hypothetical protein n=1 Tax=unclassified Variovorax TaxID=663243 RepID=UPI00131E6A48|nr:MULTISPECIES: hypothetical protein [unclassified Variovorax]QRY35235.1 hypothetical protein JVX96_28245 [Variovorax sp. PDNC026]